MKNNEPPPPFPVDVLPSPFKEFVQEAAASFPCPLDFVGVPLLTLAGAAIGLSRVVEIKPGWTETARLWATVISPPGTIKSPPMKAATQWHYRRETENRIRFKKSMAEFLDGNQKGPKPVCERVCVTDTTTEALIRILEENPRGLALYNDELSGWVQSIGQYKESGSADRKIYLSIWSHQPITVDRITREGNYVPRPFLSITGGIQPDVLRHIGFHKKGTNDGFIDRILFCEPTIVRVRYTTATISPLIIDRVGELFDQLFRLPMLYNLGKCTNESVAQPFSPEAKPHFIKWLNKHLEETESEHTPEYLRGPFSKMKGYVGSFALIIARMRKPRGTVIDLDSTLGAIALAQDFFKPHARRIYDRVFGDQKTDSGWKLVWCQEKIVQVLKSRGSVLFRDLHQAISGRYTAEETRAALQVLVNCKTIDECPEEGQRGVAVMRYELSSRERMRRAEPPAPVTTSSAASHIGRCKVDQISDRRGTSH